MGVFETHFGHVETHFGGVETHFVGCVHWWWPGRVAWRHSCLTPSALHEISK